MATPLERAIRRTSDLSTRGKDSRLKLLQDAAGMDGADGVLSKIARLADEEQIRDHLAELRYGCAFGHIGFKVKSEPTGPKGPDLRVERDGQVAFVEVNRRRENLDAALPEVQHDSLDDTFTLDPYGGDPEKEIKNRLDIVAEKFKQANVGSGAEVIIIAFWSDRDAFEEIECRETVERMLTQADAGIVPVPAKAMAVVFASPCRSKDNECTRFH